jgi:hypothetical protein
MRNNGGVVGLNVLLASDQHDFCIMTKPLMGSEK